MNEDLFDELEQEFKDIESGKKPETKIESKPPIKEINENAFDLASEESELNEEEIASRSKLSVGNFIEMKLTTIDYNVNSSYLSSQNGYNPIIYRNCYYNQPITAKVQNIIGNSHDETRGNLTLDVELVVTPINQEYPRNIIQLRVTQNAVTKKYVKAISDYDVLLTDVMMECEEYSKKYRAIQRKKQEEEQKKAEEAAKKKQEEEAKKLQERDGYMNKLKEIAEFFHPDCWSLDELNPSTDYIPNNIYKYRLTIKFPEFIITNSRKNSHLIKDMYLALHFSEQFVIYPGLIGRRGTLTYEEWQSAYGHSHMGTGNYGWASMCLGDSNTPLNEALSEASVTRKWNEDGIKKVLALLHGYINWESLEGNPYIKISSISRKNTTLPIASDTTIRNTYLNLVNNLKDETTRKQIGLKLSSINNFNKFIFNRDEIEKILISCVDSSFLVYKSSDGTYVSMGENTDRLLRDIASLNDSNKRGWNQSKLIKWQGKYLMPTVVLNYNGMDNLVKVPTPNLTEGIFRMLETEINNYNLKNKKYELG